MTTYTSNNNQPIDWSQFTAQAMFEGGQAFLQTISVATPDLDDAHLQADGDQADRRYAQALDTAKQSRSNPVPALLSAVRNWSRKQAIAILREKVAGKPIRSDFYTPFQLDLQEVISTLTSDLQRYWEQEDEQREAVRLQQAALKREEEERAFGRANKYVVGLHEAVLSGERQRQLIFNDGVKAAQGWADKYEESVKQREQELEARVRHIEQQEKEHREHQLALRSLAKWDDRRSFADTVVSTGKNVTGCLFLWIVLVVGILLAIYFAFPAHH